MFVEEIKSKQGHKTYTATLVRESYRENGKVMHRTVSNISKFSNEHKQQIKQMFKGNKYKFNASDLKNGKCYNYGGVFALRKLAEQIGLDKVIFSTKTQWREDVLGMIIGRIIHQGSKLRLINTYETSALWGIAGHKYGTRPDVDKNCYFPMDELIKRKDKIERKLAKKHLKNGCVLLYDITNTWLEGDYDNSYIVARGKGKGGKVGYKQVAIGLLTDHKGCPIGIEIFKGNTSDQTTVLDQLKKINTKYGIENAIFTGDRGMLTQSRIDEIDSDKFKIITALNHKELEYIVKKENIQLDLFDEMKITEIIDSEDTTLRYMLCKNEKEKIKERRTRQSLIDKVSELLTKKATVKRKRQQQKVCASIGRIFEKYKIEKFFTWTVDEIGKLDWELKKDFIEAEKKLDGCYVIKSNATCKSLNKQEVVDSYRGLQQVEQAFKNMKTILLELRPIHHKTDERIKSHIFIVMLAYYLQWHAMQKLEPLFENDKIGKEQRWTFEGVIDSLQGIKRVENIIEDTVIKINISEPCETQREILELLGVSINN